MKSSFIRGKARSAALVGLSVLGAVALGATIVGAATTINANINTAGTLTVSGHSAFATASSTITSQTGNFMVNGYATTTASSGNIATAGALSVALGSTLTGTVAMSGAATVGTTLDVTGATTLSSTLSVASATSTLASTTVANLLTVGTTTPRLLRGDVIVDSSGTTTLWLTSSSATKGGCIQLENDAGVVTRIYVNGTTLRIEAGDCR